MKYIIKSSNGNVAIMELAEGADAQDAFQKFKDSHSDENFIDFFKFDGKLPLNREFRDAWKLDGRNVVIDEVKAADIHIERIRAVRNEQLDKLDKEQLRYLSIPDKLAEIEEKKQLLRDLPSKVKDLSWPEELPR